jgi:hypothetical protein
MAAACADRFPRVSKILQTKLQNHSLTGDMPKRGQVTFLGDVNWVINGNPDPEKVPDRAVGYVLLICK